MSRLSRWIDFHFSLVMWASLLAVILGIGLLVSVLAARDERAAAAACRRMWAASRTSADTVAVIRACEMPAESHSNTTVIPVFIHN